MIRCEPWPWVRAQLDNDPDARELLDEIRFADASGHLNLSGRTYRGPWQAVLVRPGRDILQVNGSDLPGVLEQVLEAVAP